MQSEIRSIVDAIDGSSETLFLATVVDVVGSSYRRPTARMLIFPDGSHIGTISGGCLERDLCQEAKRLTRNGPKLISFDTRQNSSNFNPRYNLGCSGIIYMLVERITRLANCPTEPLRQVVASSKQKVFGTIYQAEHTSQLDVGDRLMDCKSFVNCFGANQEAVSAFDQVWSEVAATGVPICCEVSGEPASACRMLIERLCPPPDLFIFGAGDDAKPLASVANELGWRTFIVDQRHSLASQSRFPSSGIVNGPWQNCIAQISGLVSDSSPHQAAVLLTHDLKADCYLLPRLLRLPFDYVGILGPKNRTGKAIRILYSEGDLPSSESLDRLHTPVGLDIGASTAPEIALSILGEIVATRNKRSGGRLQDREAPVHEPVAHRLIQLRKPEVIEHELRDSQSQAKGR